MLDTGPVVIKDADKQPENRDYQLKLDGDGSELFAINETTNQVFLKETSVLDAESEAVYNIQVRIFHHSISSPIIHGIK